MKLYSESGRLSEVGKKATAEFREMTKKLLSLAESAQEARLLGSILSSLINDCASEEALKKR